MVLGRNKSFYLSQRLKCSCKYLTYKEWKLELLFLFGGLPGGDSKYLTYKEWKHDLLLLDRVWSDHLRCKYLTYKECNPIGILIYLLGFTLFSQKKDSSTVSDTAAFLHSLYFIFFSDTVYLFIYYSEIYSKSFLTVILYNLTFKSFISFSKE